MKKVVMFLCVLAVSSVLAGCNTARGFGADLEVLGKTMKNAGKKDAETAAETPASGTTTYPAEDPAYTQPYQDPSYAPASGTAPATTYPEYK